MARKTAIEFDAQCDVAALVYRKSDEADRLLSDFGQNLASSGYRVVGLTQTRLANGSAAVVVLPTGETFALAKSSSRLCELAPAAARVDVLIEAGADLVIINRFGTLEAGGQGLVDEMALAIRRDIPVVIAVPEFRFSEWLSFCHGMAVKLPCQDGMLRAWWKGTILGGAELPGPV